MNPLDAARVGFDVTDGDRVRARARGGHSTFCYFDGLDKNIYMIFDTSTFSN